MSKITVLLFIFLFASNSVNASPRVRPSEWASPIIESELQNLYKVSKKVFRSEQPNGKAFHEIQALGITSVLNLRNHHTDNDEAEGTKLLLHLVKIDASSITPEKIYQSLAIIKNSKGPILIHCWHGSDRTGTIIAAYRMAFQNWSKEKAIDEFQNGGYGYRAKRYPNLVELLKSLNVREIQDKLNLQPLTGLTNYSTGTRSAVAPQVR